MLLLRTPRLLSRCPLLCMQYLPVSLAYVLPMMKWRPDVITAEARAVPQKVWLIMGTLDSIAGVMQSLATAYLNTQGALVVLLLQSAIPSSMLITKVFLKTKYKLYQYAGAAAVIAGILVVLVPQLTSGAAGGGSTTGIWSAVLVLSCVPMCLSSVYKEKALGDTEIVRFLPFSAFRRPQLSKHRDVIAIRLGTTLSSHTYAEIDW